MAEHTCHDLLADLSAYIDGELDPALCLEIEKHMDNCRNCRTVLTTLSETVALYRALPPAAVPEDVTARLRAALGLDDPAT